MNDQSQNDWKPIDFGRALLMSFGIFNLGFVIDQTVRWSNHFFGLLNGIVHIFFFGINWFIYLLPWSLIVIVLYQSRKSKRFRMHWILAPSVLTLIVSITQLVTYPETPSSRFKWLGKVDLPNGAQNLHYHFSGGGFTDYLDTYYFETSPDEVDRLITEMRLHEDENYGHEGRSHTLVRPLPKCPDFSTWKGAKQYRVDDQEWFYYLITDGSRTKVYVVIGCI